MIESDLLEGGSFGVSKWEFGVIARKEAKGISVVGIHMVNNAGLYGITGGLGCHDGA